jgi:UDP-GlcNAc:undecaprenyl-phosphate GlcNAc-1-phosphate transferase
MEAFLGLSVGLLVTMVLLPPLVRISGVLRLLDRPGVRKVHSQPIPRVGGIAIFVGFLVPLVIWGPHNGIAPYFYAGCGLIVLFGVADDRYSLSPGWKLLGQTLAILVVMSGGLHFDNLPFLGLDPVSPWISYPFSFLFILGVTNALNLSDGLDGLAGGITIVSLAGIAILSFSSGGGVLVYLGAAALIGAIFGFLRFNTYPAVVFLGDAGSQFLGFALAILSILLIKDVNPALNPALPIFLIGLPILDTLSVVILRMRSHCSPFSADNRHMHHRILALGFEHHEAVSIIYALQATLVTTGLLTRYQDDVFEAVIIILFAISVFGLLYVYESKGWRLRSMEPATAPVAAGEDPPFVERRNLTLRRWQRLPTNVAIWINAGVAIFLLLGTFFAVEPPRDFAIVSLGVGALMLFAHLFLHPWTRLFTRLGFYLLSLFVVYLIIPPSQDSVLLDRTINIYLFALSCMLALAIRLTRRENFQMTPQDVLILFFVLAVPNLRLEIFADYQVGWFALRVGVLLYACEFILNNDRISFRWLRMSGFIGLVILGLRGLI